MSKKKAAAAPAQVRIDKPDTNQLKGYGGSDRDRFNTVLLNAVVGTFGPQQLTWRKIASAILRRP
jgi:hypothetical protein